MERTRKTGIGYQHVKIFSFGNALKIDLFEGKHRRAKIMIIGIAEKEELLQIRRLYMQAFPKAERKPFAMIKQKVQKGSMDILAVRGENLALTGFAITLKYKDMVLIDYFAIAPEFRNRGVGSEALRLLREWYRDIRLFLEIEVVDPEAVNYEERRRRKQFYLRNGFSETGKFVSIFGVRMELMTYQCEISCQDYIQLYEHGLSKAFAEVIKGCGDDRE